MTLFSKDELEREPIVARVNEKNCVACFYCKKVCPYGAVEEKEIRDRQGNLIRSSPGSTPASAAAAAPARPPARRRSVELDGYTDEQVMAMIDAL